MNFGKNLFGEKGYMILNATSGAGAPMMYYFSDSYVTGIKEDEPNTFLNGTKFKELEPKSRKVENLSELLIDEGIAKLKNMTTKEIKELFEKEGLNPKSFDKVNGKGSGQKFSIPNNKFMIPADFEKDKRKMITIGSVRTNSGASHGSLPYILFGTNDGKYKIVLMILKIINIILLIKKMQI